MVLGSWSPANLEMNQDVAPRLKNSEEIVLLGLRGKHNKNLLLHFSVSSEAKMFLPGGSYIGVQLALQRCQMAPHSDKSTWRTTCNILLLTK